MKLKLRSIYGYEEIIEVESFESLKKSMKKLPYVELVDYNVLNMLCGFDNKGNVVLTVEEMKKEK